MVSLLTSLVHHSTIWTSFILSFYYTLLCLSFVIFGHCPSWLLCCITVLFIAFWLLLTCSVFMPSSLTVSSKTLCFRLSVRRVCPSVPSSVQILLTWTQYLMNGLSNLDETYKEWPLAPTDDLVRFWRSKVKVTAGRRGGEGIHVVARASKSIF